MSKISKFIFIPILALLLCFSIVFVGCSNKNNSSNNSSNSNNNNNNNISPPQNINYFQKLGKYIEQNGEHFESQKFYTFQFAPPTNTTEYQSFEGNLDYYPDSYFKIMGNDESKKASVELRIQKLTDYSRHKYSVYGIVDNLYEFSVSFTAENATVPFASHNIPTDNSAKFNEYVQNAQYIINTTIQSFSSYFSKKVLNSSDDMAFAKAFHLPTKVTITNTIQK